MLLAFPRIGLLYHRAQGGTYLHAALAKPSIQRIELLHQQFGARTAIGQKQAQLFLLALLKSIENHAGFHVGQARLPEPPQQDARETDPLSCVTCSDGKRYLSRARAAAVSA